MLWNSPGGGGGGGGGGCGGGGGGGFFLAREDLGRMSFITRPRLFFFFLLFFKVEISTRTLIPLLRSPSDTTELPYLR